LRPQFADDKPEVVKIPSAELTDGRTMPQSMTELFDELFATLAHLIGQVDLILALEESAPKDVLRDLKTALLVLSGLITILAAACPDQPDDG
jgi:hypothetical protein